MVKHTDVVSALMQLETDTCAHVTVSALNGGNFTLPQKFFVSGAGEAEKTFVPSLAFLVTHPADGERQSHVLYDLGIRRDVNTYTPQIQSHLHARQPMKLLPDVRDSLMAGGLGADSIDHIILSHVHWDHIGTPLDYPTAQFYVGAGSLKVLKDGLGGHMSHSNFQPNLFDDLNVSEFPPPTSQQLWRRNPGWKRRGGLDLLDFFGDGSVFVVDAPGHLNGHVAMLARLGVKKWVLLIGDACHDARLLSREMSIAEWQDTEGRTCCIHMNKKEAAGTLEQFSSWKDASATCGIDIRIVFAHDVDWAEATPTAFFPGAM